MFYVVIFLYSTATIFSHSWGRYLRVPQRMLEAACIYILYQTRNLLETWLGEVFKYFLKLKLYWIGLCLIITHFQSRATNRNLFFFFPLWSSNFSLHWSPVKSIETLLADQTREQKFPCSWFVPALCQHDKWQTARSAQRLWVRWRRRRRRSASRSLRFLGTQGVTAEEEIPRRYLIRQILCCDADCSEVYAHPFSHLPLATEEWTEEQGYSGRKRLQGPVAAGLMQLSSC